MLNIIHQQENNSHYNKYRIAKTKLTIPMVDEESSVISHPLLIWVQSGTVNLDDSLLAS